MRAMGDEDCGANFGRIERRRSKEGGTPAEEAVGEEGARTQSCWQRRDRDIYDWSNVASVTVCGYVAWPRKLFEAAIKRWRVWRWHRH